MMWNGIDFKKLVIFVDVSVCDGSTVAKYSRHAQNELNQTQESFHKHEFKMMRNLKEFQRNGFILAKAVRISNISRPSEGIDFGLEEDIYADSVITSFILKCCLFGEKEIKENFECCGNAIDVASKIYQLLHKALVQKLLQSAYTGERPVDCVLCRVERGCCKKRLFMTAMVEKIMMWLNNNRDCLMDMNFY